MTETAICTISIQMFNSFIVKEYLCQMTGYPILNKLLLFITQTTDLVFIVLRIEYSTFISDNVDNVNKKYMSSPPVLGYFLLARSLFASLVSLETLEC